eukprot:CAMPEP_0206042550 /NCGR_PEP_ID=MMETSP1466-20131121/6626_1 /ASSEMBLY_ACC=CAM_ASM_001126 /TAXON_ID=44452 /ORGANISM="Pavlova gyrans, Strain CCMP608" /LENGTH=50 /DNA_ID=CAMNT_0053417263 /DNA_START=1 /DNA_END=150 /DNA_ORIENTATION=+
MQDMLQHALATAGESQDPKQIFANFDMDAFIEQPITLPSRQVDSVLNDQL